MRCIRYWPKNTASRANYVEISEEDRLWLISELTQWCLQIAEWECRDHPDRDYLLWQYWHRRRAGLPKSQWGPNTPHSLTAGLVWNMMFKPEPQRDFTEPQIRAIEDISRVCAVALEREEIRFQLGFTDE